MKDGKRQRERERGEMGHRRYSDFPFVCLLSRVFFWLFCFFVCKCFWAEPESPDSSFTLT